MAKYDIENLLTDLAAIAKTNLNTKIAAITAEKNDDIVLKTIDSGAYFFQSLAKNRAASYPVFLFYGMDDPTADGIGPGTAETVNIFFLVVLQDTAEEEVYMTRLLRYSRALKEIFEENYATIRRVSRILVSNLAPVSFEIENVSGTFKAVGVKVRATLA
jgi:hypothetical protein